MHGSRRRSSWVTSAVSWLSVLVLLVTSGCVSVKETVRNEDRPVSQQRREVPISGPPQYAIRTHLTDTKLTCEVRRTVPCEVLMDSTIDRTVITERISTSGKYDSKDAAISAVLGGALTVAGAVLMGLSPRFSGKPGVDDDGKETLAPRHKALVAGGVLGGVGLVFLITGSVDAARLKDSRQHVGNVTTTQSQGRTQCAAPNSGETVTFVLPNGRSVSQSVGPQGSASFDIPDAKTLVTWASDPRFKVVVGGVTTEVRFDTLPGFKQERLRQELEDRRLLEAQRAAEKSLAVIAKGDAMWVSLDPRETAGFRTIQGVAGPSGFLYALTERGELSRSADSGMSWSRMAHSELAGLELVSISLDPRDPETVVLASRRGDVRISRDGGDSWVALEALGDALTPRDGQPAVDGVGFLRAVLVARDEPVSSEGQEPGGAASFMLAATSRGLMRGTTEPDAGWVRVEGVPEVGVRSVATAAQAPNRLFVVMDDGSAFRSDDSGRNWQSMSMAGLLNTDVARSIQVHPADADILFVLAGDATVLRSRDGGQSFERVATHLDAGILITQLQLDPKNLAVVYAASNAGILWSTDLGATFRPLTGGLADAGTLRVTDLELTDGQLYALASGTAGLLRLGTVEDKQTLQNVSFEVNSARIKPAFFQQLEQVVTLLQANPRLMVRVDGHTDSTGKFELNQDLSRRRAQAVLEFLGKRGIAAGRMVFEGYADRFPIDDNDTEAGRQRNRRVEIYVIGSRGGTEV